MDLQLELVGIQFFPDRLVIERTLETDELKRVLSFVVNAHDASTWWAGDVLAYINETKGEEAAREAARQFQDPLEIWDSMRVCEQLRGTRISGVGYRHHRAALDECRGDSKAALHWIMEARQKKWEISELRANIRRSMSSTPANGQNEGKRRLNITSEIRRFHEALRNLVSDRPIQTWNFEECAAFLSDLQPTLEIIDKIGSRRESFLGRKRTLVFERN